MKKTIQSHAIRLLALIFLGFGVLGLSNQALAQNNVPAIDFEVDGNGADWDWVTFENIDNPALEFIDNPDASGINESARVAKFTARADGQPWAGTTGRDGTTFLFDEANRTITIMVWKSVISNVGIKLETASGWSQGEILVANTKVNEWEEIVLDFTGRENPPGGEMFNGISVFPDFNLDGRGQENVIYFDNIEFEGFVTGNGNGNGGSNGDDVATIDFEVDGNGADWDWMTFENADNPALEFIDNPDASGINESARVAKFTAREGGAPWAGTRVTGGPTFLFDEGNRTITIMVWKSVISNVGIKLETASGWSQGEILVANTKVNEWEEIVLDFTGRENPPGGEKFDGVSVFPDFNLDGRGQENVIYFDNIVFDGFATDGDNGNGNGGIDGEDVAAIDFEVDGNGAGANWDWITFANGDDPLLEFIDNPDASGINESARVAKFTARVNGEPFAGTRGTGGSTYLFNEENRTISIMVWKSVISNVGIKLETASNWAQGEILVANTKVNEWEEIVIDFTGRQNPPNDEPFNGITVFPDFQNRDQENVIYFDNIVFEGFVALDDGGNGDAPTVAAPAPTQDAEKVISIFSDAYTDVEGTNFNPGWGQSTQVSFEEIEGSNTMKYANFNYQGTEFTPAIDASGMTAFHFDMWTADASTVNFTVISPGPQEKLFPLEITQGEWVSYNIPLAYFDNVNLADIFQLKFDGGDSSPTIYLDNIFFYDGTDTSIEDDALPVGFELSQNYPNPFNPTTQIRFNLPQSEQVTLQVFNVVGQQVATLVDGAVSAGSHTVSFDASNLSSGVYIYRLQASNVVLTKKMVLVK